jgi:hypothetical protein
MIAKACTAALVAAALAVAGCGSSTPSYCSQRTTLSNAVKSLPSTIVSSGTTGLQQQVDTIKKEANSLVSSAKSDFPSETSAITSSVNSLSTSAKALPSSPSATQLAPVAADATSVVTAVKGFSDAAASKCD